MITRTVRRQLAIFAVLSVVALGLAGFKYADAPAATGIGRQEISADFAQASGLYPRALVTYRGVTIGKVRALVLTPEGVRVRMSVDRDVRIPTSSTVSIKSTSAIGEQYVDLEPKDANGPYLRDGAVVPQRLTREMPQIAPVLESLNSLLKSVPKEQTTALLDEVDTALGGSGQDLGTVIDETTKLVRTAQSEVRATTSLIETARPLLRTQTELAPTTSAWITSLESFTGDLQAGDGDLRGVVDEVPGTTRAASGLLDTVRPSLPATLRSTTTVAGMLRIYEKNIRQVLITYPALQGRLGKVLSTHATGHERGAAKLDLKLNVNDPPPCITGYLPVKDRRDPAITSLTDTPSGLYCKKPSTAPEVVRGARNQPCPNVAGRRGGTPASCGLFFTESASSPGIVRADGSVTGGPVPDGATSDGRAATRSAARGGTSPVSFVDMLGGVSDPPGGESWQSVLTTPLRR
ncbi:MAG: MlaD family protein [Aeromicrobium erythreum]